MAQNATPQSHGTRFDKETIAIVATLLTAIIGGVIWLVAVGRDLGQLEGKVSAMGGHTVGPIAEAKHEAIGELKRSKVDGLNAIESSRSKALSDVKVSSDEAVGAVTDTRNDALKKAKAGLTALENAKDSALSDVSDAEKKALDAVSGQVKAMLDQMLPECEWKEVDFTASSNRLCPRQHLVLDKSDYIYYHNGKTFQLLPNRVRCCRWNLP